VSSISSLFETLLEEECTELQTKVKDNFEKGIEDLKNCIFAVTKHCEFVRDSVTCTEWGKKLKTKIAMFVDSFHQRIEAAEI
jgi:hypothetical protein